METAWLLEYFAGDCPDYIKIAFKDECITSRECFSAMSLSDLEEFIQTHKVKLGHRVALRVAHSDGNVRIKEFEVNSRGEVIESNAFKRRVKVERANQQRPILLTAEKKVAPREKQTYIVHVGVKRLERDQWTRDARYKITKINVPAKYTYDQVMLRLKAELSVKGECVMLNGRSQTVNVEGFCFVQSILKERRYKGVTRMYLGIKPLTTATEVKEATSTLVTANELLEQVDGV